MAAILLMTYGKTYFRNEMMYSESKPFIMKLGGFLVYMSVQAYYNRSCSESSVVSDPLPETDKGYLD